MLVMWKFYHLFQCHLVFSYFTSEPECSSIASSMIRTEHGSDTDDYKSFNQFDVVQDFSDHHYAKNSPGKVYYVISRILFLLDPTVN